MKNLYILIFVFMFTSIPLNAQESIGMEKFIPVNSPDAMAFSTINFIPINEYTGKTNISIPIYEIDLDGLKVPISLSYNYGGVKVNSIASNVGANWALNAGGSIIREVNGILDFKQSISGVFGYMTFPFSGTIHNGCFSQHREGQPDMYHVSAPGINTSFITIRRPDEFVREEFQCKEINHKGNKITVWGSPMDTGGYTNNFVNTKIINTSGYTYNFSNAGKMRTKSRVLDYINGNVYGAEVWGWNIDGYNSSLDITTIKSPISDKEVTFSYEKYSVDKPFNYPYSSEDVNFDMVKGVFRENGSLRSKYETFVRTHKDRIKIITFDNGSVEFFYSFPRLDLYEIGLNYTNSASALSRILVKNINGKVLKDARLNYTSKQSVYNCTDIDCYRLFLDEVEFYDGQGNQLPGYTFSYNATKLPKRYSYKQDFLGYYNGAVANPEPDIEGHYIPITYHKPENGKDSYLPINLGLSGYQTLNGNYSLEANDYYAKAGILEQITYPTGGYTILESESNQFQYLGSTVIGGGLRIKTQKIYDLNDNLEKEISYEYKNVNGSTSGSITSMPRFNNYNLSNGNNGNSKGYGIYQNDMSNQKLTNNSHVGYNRVKIRETGNGYTIKEFTSPNDYPNIPGSPFVPNNPNPSYEVPLSLINEAIDNGCFPNIVSDRDLLRGKPTNVRYYSENNLLQKNVETEYTYKEYESIGIAGFLPYIDSYGDGCDTYPSLIESAHLKIERNLVEENKETLYSDGNPITNQINYEYEDDYPFISTKNVVNSEGTNYKEIYKYPFDSPFAIPIPRPRDYSCNIEQMEIMNEIHESFEKLVEQNRISTPFYIQKFEDDILTNNILKIYKKFPLTDKFGNTYPDIFIANGSPLIENEQISKTNLFNLIKPELDLEATPYICKLEEGNFQYIIHKYDRLGNRPIEVSKNKESKRTILIWGYNNQYVIGKIENATYTGMPIGNIESLFWQINQISSFSNTEDSENEELILRNMLQELMLNNFFSKAQLTTYTYDPLIGMTSSTDEKGYTIFYEYDSFNRLLFIKDKDGNILSKNEYNYANQN